MELKQYGMIGGAAALVAGIGIALVKRAKNKKEPEISQVNMASTQAKAPEVKVITTEVKDKPSTPEEPKTEAPNLEVKEPDLKLEEGQTPESQTPALTPEPVS